MGPAQGADQRGDFEAEGGCVTSKSINSAPASRARLPVDGLFGSIDACRCESCTDDPAPTYTREFRHECEVREVAGMESNQARRDYLALVEKKRGLNAATRLREGAWKLMNEREAA